MIAWDEKPVVITVAPTGAEVTREQHPAIPYTPQEIAAEVQQFQQQQLKSGKFGSFGGAVEEAITESAAQPNSQQPGTESNSWRDYLPRQEQTPASNSGSTSNLANSVQSALNGTFRTAPGRNSFQQPQLQQQSQPPDNYQPQMMQQYQQYQSQVQTQAQGAYQQVEDTYRNVQDAYQQVQDSYRQAKEHVESSPLFAPRTKVTR